MALLGLAQQAASAYLVFSTVGIRVLQPHIAAPPDSSGRLLRRLSMLYGVFITLLWLGSMGAAALLLRWLLDPRYYPSLNLMLLLLTAAFLNGVGSLAAVYLIMCRQERVVLTANLVGALLYAAFCGPLIQQFGPTGAGGLTTAVAALIVAMLWLQFPESRLRH
jgi:O-antigen/teichoic acid export membrane protein